jgi:acetoin utilization protein AcuB
MQVSDVMTRTIVTVPATATCHDAMMLMVRHRIRHLPVVCADGTLAGIVTDRDLRHHLFRPDVFPEIERTPVEELLSSVKVWEMMTSPVVSVAPSAELEAAARRMLEDKLGSLPVVEDGGVVGIITETDLLRRFVARDACGCDLDVMFGSP